MTRRAAIEVRGIVQGVGFRPHVYRLAIRMGLTGYVLNSGSGVSIQVQGEDTALQAFATAVRAQAPPLAQVHDLSSKEMPTVEGEANFVIRESAPSGHADTLISPDIATCDACMAECLDPADRRYRYPFLNCTDCGPRFTITRSVPYDRAQTSMAVFAMCELCQSEYDDPMDRRFHAQPNACWTCGPQLLLVDRTGAPVEGDPVAGAVRLLRAGAIVAIKGIGGFHLSADATNAGAVATLRQRKQRGGKPFAAMVADVASARGYAEVSREAEAALLSPQRPIVLLPKVSTALAALAPEGNELGIFLPYTPLHHLLMHSGELTALVMTSGNRADEPIAIANDEALARLSGIADYFLLHNREILLRCDDSVMRIGQIVRRSRGYVPAPLQIEISRHNTPVLAAGGDLKNTICMSRGGYAFPGQHVGDLAELAAYGFFEESVTHFERILEVRPQVIAHDLHPGYLSTQWARKQTSVRHAGVQHHHAHIASCMAENHLDGKVIGIALDGTGYGTDGNAWGGELLIAGYKSFERAAHLRYTPMPGGEAAIHQPWRMSVAHLWQAFGAEWRAHLPEAAWMAFPQQALSLVEQQLRAHESGKTRMPLTSSCGRLFDAVAALVLGRTEVTYEAQAAMALEACCSPTVSGEYEPGDAYRFASSAGTPMVIDPAPMFAQVSRDLREHVPVSVISRRFHEGVCDAFASAAISAAQRSGLDRVCLSGGVFHNVVLLAAMEQSLRSAGLTVFVQTQVSPGDGGLSLGQLAVAAHSL